MSGGIWAKAGNWYEEEFVVLQWLRLLGEHVQSVQWEAMGDDEPGIDVWIEEDGQWIAIQCKSRSRGNWNRTALIKERIPRHACAQLQREGGANKFRLVTTTDAPILRTLSEWAGSNSTSASLDKEGIEFVRAMGLEPGTPQADDHLRSIAARIELQVLGAEVLEERVRELAGQLGGKDSDRLLGALRKLRTRQILSRRLHADELRNELPDDIAWRHSLTPSTVHERVQQWRHEFVADSRGARRIQPPIVRPEVQKLSRLISSGSCSRTILVHGEAGTGKSDVLAEVVEVWPSDQGIVIPLRADEAEDLMQERLTPEHLVRVAGNDRVAIVVDQLDQLLQGGPEAQHRVRSLERMFRAARRMGCTIVVGCRTVDAKQDTQMHQLLFGGSTGKPDVVEVGLLAEIQVQPVLTRLGVTWNSLGPDVRRLLRRPVCLGIVQDLVAHSEWQGSRSLHELVSAWCLSIVGDDQSLDHALDAVIEKMEGDGSLSVDPLRLKGHESAIQRLVDASVLQRDSRWRIRPAHQVLVDSRLARQLGECPDAASVRVKLGPRDSQGLHAARRLRLAVTIFANRGALGAQILDHLFRSDDVRPLVKRALLLGLAEEIAPIEAPLRNTVLAWLADPDSRRVVSETLLRSRGNWMEACRPWLESEWGTGDRERRDIVLHLLASVSEQRGDFVAELLGAWSRDDADVLSRAHWMFWQDPSKDSDALFELRMAAPGPVGLPSEHYEWSELLSANPKRGAKLLGSVLRKLGGEIITMLDARVHSLPGESDFTGPALEAAGEFWAEAREWWMRLGTVELRFIVTGLDPVPIVEIVQALARCLSRLLDDATLSWDELVEQLDPLRDLDAWLLLEAGARLSERASPAAEAAAAWLKGEPRFVSLEVGRRRRHSDYQLVSAFAKAMGRLLPDDAYAEFESWILEYREDWSPADEARRMELARMYGPEWPNDRGLMAYRVLPELPPERLSLAAKSRLAECRRKFGPVEATMLQSFRGVGGWMGSKVPNDVMRQLSPAEWEEKLRTAPEHDPNPVQLGDDQVGEYNLELLIRQLCQLARNEPRVFLPTAEYLASREQEFKDELYAPLLEAVGSAPPSSGVPAREAWEPATDQDVARLVALPAFLARDSCALSIGRVVESRPRFEWPPVVIERLILIARRTPSDQGIRWSQEQRPQDVFITIQWNDESCTALRALKCLAAHHSDLHDQLMDMAEDLVDRDPPVRRAAAGALAYACRAGDGDRARNLVLRACEDDQVAASPDGLIALAGLSVLGERHAGGDREVMNRLLELVDSHDAQVARIGGQATVWLCLRNMLDSRELAPRLRASPAARRGAAERLGPALHDGRRSPWILDYAIELLNDEDAEVGKIVLGHVVSQRNRTLLHEDEFLSQLIRSNAAQHGRDKLLRTMDEDAQLSPMAEHIFEIAEGFLAQDPEALRGRDAWRLSRQARDLVGLLARLVEEAEREGKAELRLKALDTWDRFIVSRPFDSGGLVAELTA